MEDLLEQAIADKRFHKARAKKGEIETLCASVRIRAILDCMKAEGKITEEQAREYMKRK